MLLLPAIVSLFTAIPARVVAVVRTIEAVPMRGPIGFFWLTFWLSASAIQARAMTSEASGIRHMLSWLLGQG